jgi:hypothetical protein
MSSQGIALGGSRGCRCREDQQLVLGASGRIPRYCLGERVRARLRATCARADMGSSTLSRRRTCGQRCRQAWTRSPPPPCRLSRSPARSLPTRLSRDRGCRFSSRARLAESDARRSSWRRLQAPSFGRACGRSKRGRPPAGRRSHRRNRRRPRDRQAPRIRRHLRHRQRRDDRQAPLSPEAGRSARQRAGRAACGQGTRREDDRNPRAARWVCSSPSHWSCSR